jgi:putative phosphoribosyl transferase
LAALRHATKSNMTFESRQDAGRKLGSRLRDTAAEVEVVLGLPRGGVVVAAEVARVLQRPLDVLIVRKIGHPFHREFAVGALAEGDIVVLDQSQMGRDAVGQEQLRQVIGDESKRLGECERIFGCGKRQPLAGRRAVVVDDGLATGATMEAAVLSARKRQASLIIVAVPVASTTALERLERVADAVVALFVDPDFDAVGHYYEAFSQTSDDEVVALLKSAESMLQ